MGMTRQQREAAHFAGPEWRALGATALASEHRLCGPKYDGCYSHWEHMAHCRADGMAWPCDVDRIRNHIEAARDALRALAPEQEDGENCIVCDHTIPQHVSDCPIPQARAVLREMEGTTK